MVYSTEYIWNKVWCTVQYIILKYGILKLNFTILASSKVYISRYTSYGVYGLIVDENNERIISIIFFKNVILAILGLNSEYEVKHSPPSLGVPSGFALRNYLRQRALFGRISLVSS